MDLSKDSNQVTLIGSVLTGFRYSHTSGQRAYYIADISVRRLSNNSDIIPLLFPVGMIDINRDYRGMILEVSGSLRSVRQRGDSTRKNAIYVSVREYQFLYRIEDWTQTNSVELCGAIFKQAVYRRTAREKRNICDLLMMVRRPHGWTDYIPCIIWGTFGEYMSRKPEGTRLAVWGRLQSRVYSKKNEKGIPVFYTTHEVSVYHIETEGMK